MGLSPGVKFFKSFRLVRSCARIQLLVSAFIQQQAHNAGRCMGTFDHFDSLNLDCGKSEEEIGSLVFTNKGELLIGALKANFLLKQHITSDTISICL